MARMKKLLISLVSMIAVASLLSVNCFAYQNFTYTPLRGQETDYWCWAASNQMLLETQNRYFTQTEIAGNINSAATPLQARVRLTACAANIQWDLIDGVLNFESVKNTIDSGWAIYIHTESSISGHAMVITGYEQTSAYNNVWLQDPWGDDSTAPHDGEEGWCNYAAPVVGNYGGTVLEQCQGLRWRATIC